MIRSLSAAGSDPSPIRSDQPVIEPVTSAYVHIPFCVKKCAYCDFASYAGCLDRLPAYVDAVIREIAITAETAKAANDANNADRANRANNANSANRTERHALKTIFLGGGTPSLMPPDQIDRLLQALSDAFGLDEQAEITIEANPGTVQLEQLRAYREAGCNRISIGVQSMQPHLLKLLGRIHRPEESIESIQMAQEAGFSRISADLMFGLPEQTVADVDATARAILNLPVSHLSFYSLSLEPGTVFHDRYERHPEWLPDEETERAQYETVRERAAAAGLVPYEISNAARPGEACRHNLVYWQARPYYGFGAGAHSYVRGIRRGNTTGIEEYLSRIAATDRPFPAAATQERLSRSKQEQEFMLLGLRLLDGVDADSFADRFGGDLFAVFQNEIKMLTARGLIERSGQRVRLTRLGLYLANQVFMEFV